MNFKALYGRLSGALRPVWAAAATHVLLCVSAAYSAFRERVRRIVSIDPSDLTRGGWKRNSGQ